MQLTMPADLLTSVGLFMDIVGIIGLFVFAPEKFRDPQAGVSFALEDRELRPRWRRNQPRIPHLAQTSDAVNRQLSCFSSRYMNLLAVLQI